MSRQSSRTPRRRRLSRTARLVLGIGLATSLIAGTAASAGAVPPPPPNPSDADLAAAGGAVAAGLTEVTLGASRNPRNGIVQLPVVWPPPFRQEHETYFAGRSRWGYVNSAPDEDGVIRRYLRND